MSRSPAHAASSSAAPGLAMSIALVFGPVMLREAPSTVQPSFSSICTQARPMPLEAPVTSTRLPLRWRSIVSESSNMPHITTDDGVKLHYEEAGSGVPVVFVHEFAGDWRSWETQIRYFSRNYRCITYSARGYLPSDVPKGVDSYSQERWREDIRAVIEGRQRDRPHVV